MTTSPVSGSDPSRAFDRLHPGVQRWIWEQGWRDLRDAQEAAVAPLSAGDSDVLISAATASGKTEAAFLPICSVLASAGPSPGISALYVAPLKALINDQDERLEGLCRDLGIAVHPWHGDIAGSRKSRVLARPSGILLITPESLEALFVTRGTAISALFADLRYVVIDELHSFIGSERGAQLQSLLHRLELAVRRQVPRVGLSATLGDMDAAAEFLRPRGGQRVRVITSTAEGQELRLQLRGYIQTDPTQDSDEKTGEKAAEDATAAITAHLFRVLRGTDNLVFANTRSKVEELTDRLSRLSERQGVPNEFVPHHGALSKEIREDVEARLKDRSRPVTAICTSTLEMGIDIGSVTSVAQIGAPSAISALRQRLGRAGRRGGPAVLRLYITEPEITGSTPPQDQLRAQLVQTIAGINLLLDHWCEPPTAGGLHLSTLIQQCLSLIAQHGGVTPAEAYRTLCGQGPFHHIDQKTFATLLRDLGAARMIRQEPDGLLLHDEKGERLVNHYSFFAAFDSPVEFRLIGDGRQLGTLAPLAPLVPGGLLIFAGRRWKIISVDERSRTVELTASSGGRPPQFIGTGAAVHDRIRREMRKVYESTDVPVYLDTTAQQLLAEARANYRLLRLSDNPILGWGKDTLLFPFRGDPVMTALGLALHRAGLRYEQSGLALCLTGTTPEELESHLRELAVAPPPDPHDLAALASIKTIDRHDPLLGDTLQTAAYAARRLDVPGAWQTLKDLTASAERSRPITVPRPEPTRRRYAIGDLPYAVIDTETTGFSPLHHRLVEIALLRLHPDGTVERSFSTLVQSDQGPGPTDVHGITEADLAGAPRFAEIAGDVARLLDGAVLVAHNALFDAGMLTMEFTRAGASPDDLLTLCTLDLATRFGSPTSSLRLADCAAAEGLSHTSAHTALADATTTASLLTRYLTRAREQATYLDEIGAQGALPRSRWYPWPPSTRTQKRTSKPLTPSRPRLPVPCFTTRQEVLYADLLARAAATPHSDLTSLHEFASRLELAPATRANVHRALHSTWTHTPEAQAFIDRLTRSIRTREEA